MKYTGGCHCGAIRYEVETNLEPLIECNCSHCAIKGLILTFVPAADLKVLTDAPRTEYFFNKRHISHQFCPTCGVEVFGQGKNANEEETYGLNVRTIDGIDVFALEPKFVDGKNF